MLLYSVLQKPTLWKTTAEPIKKRDGDVKPIEAAGMRPSHDDDGGGGGG